MAPMVRVMDDQQDLIFRLKQLYENFKKEAIPRRTRERFNWYGQELNNLWSAICNNDQLLRAHDVPEGYDAKLKEAEIIKNKLIERMSAWKFDEKLGVEQNNPLASNTTGVSTSASGTQSTHEVPPFTTAEQKAASLSQSIPEVPFSTLTPAVPPRRQSIPADPPFNVNSNESNMSWNSPMGENQQTNITQLLHMLAENQKQVVKLAENQMSTRNLEPPKIQIAPFDGNVKYYRLFREMFGRAVNNTKWSNIELFMFLQSKLTGDAYSAVENLEITDESYFLAWEILDRRFNNKRKLLESTLKPLTERSLRIEQNDCVSGKIFMSTYQGIINNLKQYKASIDEVVMELILPTMNETTRARFEDHIGRDGESETPTFQQLDYFLEKELRIWSNSSSRLVPQSPKTTSKPIKSKVCVTTQNSGGTPKDLKCFICRKNHLVVECDQFLSSNDREKLLRFHKVCIFCTKHRYTGRFSPCNSRKNIKCDICQEQHITLMHPLAPTDNVSGTPSSVHVTLDQQKQNTTILPTAVVSLLDLCGSEYPVRCLVDLCAERSYVCESVVQALRLKKYKTKIMISGINGITGTCSAFVKLTLKMNDDPDQNLEVNALVVPRITGMLPASPLVKVESNLRLADSSICKQSFIGALLGGDIAPKLFLQGVPNQITSEGYLLQPTHLGWILSGASSSPGHHVSTFVTLSENAEALRRDKELAERILAFYELPEIEESKVDIDNYCEQLFKEKHYRMPDGRYVVPIPWKIDSPKLGHSYRKAYKMFIGQERKWLNNPEHYEMSNQFMLEYENLEHMSRNTEDVKSDSSKVYYVPYLSILRKEALTTKLRNVFNASMPSSNGVSLNETMWEGPKLQTNIKDVLITARSFKYIYSADISKMFRQILVLPEDRAKLRIIWRSSNESPTEEFTLNTVTYGTDAAPFLAIRTVHQAGYDNANPEIADIIKKAFYVDDLLYGADTQDEAIHQIDKIKGALTAGQLPLTKWMSNCRNVLSAIPVNDRITSVLTTDCNEVKVLGVHYNFQTDKFKLHLKKPDVIKFTKRGISSAAASFYDPLGFILPFIMTLRIFLQRIWQQKTEWDDAIADNLKIEFDESIRDVQKLNTIQISRFIECDATNLVELIGFSDASNNAQAAVIYSRIPTSNGYHVTLVTSKGNVTKSRTTAVLESKQCTIPKMELEALLTLCELYKTVKQNFSHRSIKFTAYTDSLVVLAWIRSNKRNDKKFIERRVTKIKNIISPDDLHYVKSEENPADPASRGLTAEQLSSCALWFLGPSWLQCEELPKTPYQKDTKTLVTQTTPESDDMFARFSDWEKVLRVTSVCLRWISRRKGAVTAEEIIQAKAKVLRYYQSLHLADAIKSLKNGKLVSKKHWLYSLSPFLDVDETLRVGGRLANASELTESQRHPIVIPKCHGLTLLVNFIHLEHGHASNSLMLRIIIEEFWIPGVRNVIKTCIRRCTTCIRWNARPIQQQMSQLPEARVTSSSTFDKVGVDLCGPFIIKASSLRFDRVIKVWVVNFVCFSTKAAHLELVTSLSSEHFIGAFIRFCSRRGISSEVWSDNGTNLVGANRILRKVWLEAVRDCEQHTVMQEVKWRFIPRHSPSFGGLWEACVKSLKYFTKRMADVKNLTYEEFSTLLCRIEALLNSRPLYANPLTPEQDPALTPFHFLNQKGYKALSIDSSSRIPLTKKWLIMHQIQREFWTRFKTEYLRELQSKKKWVAPQTNLVIDDVVLIKEPSTIPGDWKMGRVTRTFPDPQGVVRKVGVVTAATDEKIHAVNQLIPLLKETEDNDNQSDQNEQQNQTIEIPKARRSPRLATKISLVHLCLITLLAWFPIIPALQVEELKPGIHLKKMDDVYIKSFDIEFEIKTSLNLTHDLALIRQTANDFHKECSSLGKTSKKAADQCASLNLNIAKLAQLTATTMENGYKPRHKRWISLTAKGFWKVAPTIATSLGIVYQEAEIWSLRKQVADTKNKMVLTTNALLNITETEYEAVEGKLNEVITKQQDLLMEETVLNYAETIELLFINLQLKHETVIGIQPYEELLAYIEPLLSKLPTTQLPNLGKEIFKIHPATKSIREDNTVVSFIIPMVLKQSTSSWVIIVSPNREGDSIILSNNARVQKVIVNDQNETVADITNHVSIYYNIIENINLKTMDDCTQRIFKGADATNICKTTEFRDEEIIELYEDMVVILTNSISHSTIQCDDQSYLLTSTAAIVNTTECSIITSNRAVSHMVVHVETANDEYVNDDEITAPITDAGVSPLVHDSNAQHARIALKEQLSLWASQDETTIITEVMALLAILSFIFVAWKCWNQRERAAPTTPKWFPEYIGPMKISSLDV